MHESSPSAKVDMRNQIESYDADINKKFKKRDGLADLKNCNVDGIIVNNKPGNVYISCVQEYFGLLQSYYGEQNAHHSAQKHLLESSLKAVFPECNASDIENLLQHGANDVVYQGKLSDMRIEVAKSAYYYVMYKHERILELSQQINEMEAYGRYVPKRNKNKDVT